MDNKLKVELLAFVLLIAAFPAISLGATHDQPLVWWAGLAAVVIGGVLPITTRYADHSQDKPTDMGMAFDERTS